MLSKEQKMQFSEIFDELGTTLDISETDYNNAVSSYNAVGNWLCKDDSLLAPYNPNVLPQGSFILGTMIKPINAKDDLDIDLVCQLTGKNANWTQKDLKRIVGDQITSHATYNALLDEEGRRCWTLKYRQQSKNFNRYHMDILPSIISQGYSIILERSFSEEKSDHINELAISITDKETANYRFETNVYYWLQSNPFGYARWFYNKAYVGSSSTFSVRKAIGRVPKYQTKKLPLQRVIQILKRHRDMMFDGHCDKPISIIITTLAAHAYDKQTDVTEALIGVIERMHLFIEDRTDPATGISFKFIANPANPSENFADKWRGNPNKQKNFYKWLEAVKKDIFTVTQARGTHLIKENLSRSFGENEVSEAFKNIGNRTRLLTEQGNTRFDAKAGIIASATNIIKPHTFYGNED